MNQLQAQKLGYAIKVAAYQKQQRKLAKYNAQELNDRQSYFQGAYPGQSPETILNATLNDLDAEEKASFKGLHSTTRVGDEPDPMGDRQISDDQLKAFYNTYLAPTVNKVKNVARDINAYPEPGRVMDILGNEAAGVNIPSNENIGRSLAKQLRGIGKSSPKSAPEPPADPSASGKGLSTLAGAGIGGGLGGLAGGLAGGLSTKDSKKRKIRALIGALAGGAGGAGVGALLTRK
jgi:hypothetical protein